MGGIVRGNVMNLSELRLYTVFKLKMLKINDNNLFNRVMKSNKKTIRNIIRNYIQNQKTRESMEFFWQQFMVKSNKKYLKKRNMTKIKVLIAYELDTQLKNYFKRNKQARDFQKIVDHAISCTMQSVDERVQLEIPMWIEDNYKVIQRKQQGGKMIKIVPSAEQLYNEKLIREKINYKQMAQDIHEMVDGLNYIKHLRHKIKRKLEVESITGIVTMEDYAEFLKAQWKKVSYDKEHLQKYIVNFNEFLDNAQIPTDVVKEVKDKNYKIKSKRMRIFVSMMRKRFESWILYEKHGEITDMFYKETYGVAKLVRSPNLIFETIEENPSIKLEDFLLNSVVCRKKDYNKVYRMLDGNPNVKIIEQGEKMITIYNKQKKVLEISKLNTKRVEGIYFVYDYLAPRHWFRNVVENVLENFDNGEMTFDDRIDVEIDFPYYGYTYSSETKIKIQQAFTRNMRIFLNRNKIKGMSERKVIDEFLQAEFQRQMKDKKRIYTQAINAYQIYLPRRRRESKKKHIQKEQKRGEHYKIYGSFHHKITFNKKGKWLRGGNIYKVCKHESGNERLDKFIALIDAKSAYLERLIELEPLEFYKRRQLNINMFFEEMFELMHKVGRIRIIRTFFRNARNKLRRELTTAMKMKLELRELEYLLNEARDSSGHKIVRKNTARGKSIQVKITGLRKQTKDYNKLVERFLNAKFAYRRIGDANMNKDDKDRVKVILSPMIENYISSEYRRVVTESREIVSYCKVMANNLNIKEVVKTYTRGNKFENRMFHNYESNEIPLKSMDVFENNYSNPKARETVKLSSLIKAMLKITLVINDAEYFDDLFEFLYNIQDENGKLLKLENAETRMLSVVNGM